MRRLLACTAIPMMLVAAGVNAAPSAAAVRGGSGVVTRNGRVGPLRVGRSATANVRRFAGRPTQISSGTGEGGVAVISWRYRCGGACHTRFFFDARGRLQNFIPGSRRYHTANGTRVGDDRETAEDLEGKDASAVGCGDGEAITRVGREWLYITLNDAGTRVRFL